MSTWVWCKLSRRAKNRSFFPDPQRAERTAVQTEGEGFCRNKKGGRRECRNTEDYLCRERIELLGGRECLTAVAHLTFAYHMHDLNFAQNDACATKILETHHWARSTLDGPVRQPGKDTATHP